MRLKICERMSNIDQGAGQLAIDGERREKCVKLVGVGMSANHDIKSQPPAAHFTTILCTKSQQSRFVALPRQLPHLKKFKSLTERGRGKRLQLCISSQILWFIATTETAQFSELASFYSVAHFTVG